MGIPGEPTVFRGSEDDYQESNVPESDPVEPPPEVERLRLKPDLSKSRWVADVGNVGPGKRLVVDSIGSPHKVSLKADLTTMDLHQISTRRIVLTSIGELAINLQLESGDEGRTQVAGNWSYPMPRKPNASFYIGRLDQRKRALIKQGHAAQSGVTRLVAEKQSAEVFLKSNRVKRLSDVGAAKNRVQAIDRQLGTARQRLTELTNIANNFDGFATNIKQLHDQGMLVLRLENAE